MTNASFTYQLTITPNQKEVNISGYNTEYNFTGLPSGTSYIISVATVGTLGLESVRIESNMVTTSKEFISILNKYERILLFDLNCLYCLTVTPIFLKSYLTRRTIQCE